MTSIQTEPAPLMRWRLAAMLAVALLHLGAYWTVTRINSVRPDDVLWMLETPLDRAIPHLGWTWPAFWFGYPFVLVGGAWALWRLPVPLFARAVVAFAAMTVVGAVVQMLVPARSPWPLDAHPVQRFIHEATLTRPYASLPSMHVAYSVLVALFGIRACGQAATRWSFGLAAVLIAVSTVTLKEHFILDPVAGTVLAVATFSWWRRGTAGVPSASGTTLKETL